MSNWREWHLRETFYSSLTEQSKEKFEKRRIFITIFLIIRRHLFLNFIEIPVLISWILHRKWFQNAENNFEVCSCSGVISCHLSTNRRTSFRVWNVLPYIAFTNIILFGVWKFSLASLASYYYYYSCCCWMNIKIELLKSKHPSQEKTKKVCLQ